MMNLVRNLSPHDSDQLLEALKSTKIAASSDEMASSIESKLPSIPKKELRNIVDLLYSLYHVREFSGLNRNSFIKELFETVQQYADPPIAEEDVTGIRQRFKDLLVIKNLDTISKAISLQREEQRVYCDAKIISDIRPVFGDDIKGKPEAATITHSLRITYHEDGNHKDFYVSLDQMDLDELERIVKRAKNKANALTKALIEARIPRLGI